MPNSDRYLYEYEVPDVTLPPGVSRFRHPVDLAPRLRATPPPDETPRLDVRPQWWIEGLIGKVPNYNSNYWELPNDEKQKAYEILASQGFEAARKAGYDINEHPWYPAGKIPAFLIETIRALSGPSKGIGEIANKFGLNIEVPDVQSEDVLPRAREGGDVAPVLGTLAGEGAKYAALYRALGQVGVTGQMADLLAGSASGVLREGDIGSGAVEGAATATLGKFIRALRTEKGAATESTVKPVEAAPDAGATPAPSTKVERKVLLPVYSTNPAQQEVVLNFFGFNPQVARSVSKAWNGVVDKVAAKAVDRIPPRIKEWVHGVFYGNAPAQVKNILKQTRIRQQEGVREAIDFGRKIRELLPEELHIEATKYLDPELAPFLTKPGEKVSTLGVLPPKYKPIVVNAQNKIEQLGREAVELGLLDEGVFLKRAGEYLARYYKPSRNLYQRVRRLFIKGERFKARKLTPEEAIERGVITDPAYTVSRTIGDLTYDIETAKAFRAIAQNHEWTQPATRFAQVQEASAAGFRRIPTDARYGDLSGTWVQKDIADEIFAIIRPSSTGRTGWLHDVYDKSLALWKLGKTAWSPATQGRNLFSNIILADVGAGLSPARVDIYAKALADYIKKGPLYQEALPTGLLGTDWYGAEVGSILKPNTFSGSKSMFDAFAQSWPSKALKTPGNIYQGTEHWFKLAVFQHQRQLGATVEQAAAHAQKYLFDYSDLSPFLQKLRRSPFGGPFLTFTAKALPVMIESAVRRPIRFWKYPILLKTLHEGSKAYLGISDEEWDRINASLPEWRRNGTNVLLPKRGPKGNPRIFDLTYNLPWGQIAESPSLVKNIPVLKDLPLGVVDPFVGSNPFLNTPVEILFNRNRFLDREIYDPRVDPELSGYVVPQELGGAATERILGHVGRQLAPGFLLAAPDVKRAVTGEPGKYGERIDRIGTILNKLAGIKIVDVDVDRGLQIKASEIRKDRDAVRKRGFALEAKRANWKQRLADGDISQEQFDSFMRSYNQQIDTYKALLSTIEERAKELEKLYSKEKNREDQ